MSEEFKNLLNEEDKRFVHNLIAGEDVDQSLSRQAQKMYKYRRFVTEADDAMVRAKLRVEVLKNQLKKSFRTSDRNAKLSSTEKQLDERAETHSQYLEAFEQYLVSKKILSLAKDKLESQKDFGNMTVEIAKNRREELSAGLRSTIRKSNQLNKKES